MDCSNTSNVKFGMPRVRDTTTVHKWHKGSTFQWTETPTEKQGNRALLERWGTDEVVRKRSAVKRDPQADEAELKALLGEDNSDAAITSEEEKILDRQSNSGDSSDEGSSGNVRQVTIRKRKYASVGSAKKNHKKRALLDLVSSATGKAVQRSRKQSSKSSGREFSKHFSLEDRKRILATRWEDFDEKKRQEWEDAFKATKPFSSWRALRKHALRGTIEPEMTASPSSLPVQNVVSSASLPANSAQRSDKGLSPALSQSLSLNKTQTPLPDQRRASSGSASPFNRTETVVDESLPVEIAPSKVPQPLTKSPVT